MKVAEAQYFIWLCKGIQMPQYTGYKKMLKILHSTPFFWIVPNDDNRAGDGIQLRDLYFNSRGLDPPFDVYQEPASVLEVLIALAQRMDGQLYEPELGNRSSIWFWGFIRNLGLDIYSDEQWETGTCDRHVGEILHTFLNRKYDERGNGGLFPLRHRAKEDQRKIEIWYQMMAWFEENYP